MRFDELVQASLEDGFDALVCTPRDTGETPNQDELRCAAVIGYAGDDVRGMLGIAVSPDALARLGQAQGADGEGNSYEDALGELSNLLLGHLKRTWSKHGVYITLATPMVIRGVQIEMCQPGCVGRRQVSTTGPGEQILVWLDAAAPADLEVSEPDETTSGATEGGALFF